jgi:hypothetical protein
MVEVIVKRAFLVKGARVEPGQVVAVDPIVASELVTGGKAEVVGDVPAASGPMTTESAPAVVKGKRKKLETET